MRKIYRVHKKSPSCILLSVTIISGFFLFKSEQSAHAKASQDSAFMQALSENNISLQSDEYASNFGQGWYICANDQPHCSMWNARKVINIDPYKNIQFQVGNLQLKFPKGRPTLTSQDGRFSLSLGMMMHFDVGGFVGKDVQHGSNMSNHRSYLRRGRFIISARYDDFIVTVSPDAGEFYQNTYSLHDAYIRYVGFKNTVLGVGLIQPGSSMEDSESSNSYEFIERPMVIDMVRNISGGEPRVALEGIHWGERYYVGAYVTGQRLGENFRDFQKNQVGGLLRAAFRPVATADIDVHLGFSGAFAFHGNNRRYSMGSGPEAQIWLSRNYIRTGMIDGVDSVWTLGPEVGLRWKRLVFQSEYYQINLQRVKDGNTSRPNLSFPGWYMSTSYTIFGQPRQYDQKTASFRTPQGALFNPAAGSWGALEWVNRWSVMDLNSHLNSYTRNGQFLGSYGGKQNIWSTGLNWYPSSHMRIMLDYNHIRASSSLNNPHNMYGRNSNLLISRLQFTF